MIIIIITFINIIGIIIVININFITIINIIILTFATGQSKNTERVFNV